MRGWLRRELGFLVVALGIAAVVVTLAAIPVAGTASAPLAADRVTGNRTTQSIPAPNGASSYLGGSDANTTFSMPLVRTDAPGNPAINYDTIIHVANATTTSSTVTITFYNPDGTVKMALPGQALATWATWDVDVAATSVGLGFEGSAVVSATSAVSVAADVITNDNNGSNTDDLDSYGGLATGSVGGYVPLTINNYGYSSTLFVRNTSGAQAHVTASFYSDGQLKGATPTLSIAANGLAVIPARTYVGDFIGPVVITSDVTVAAVSEVWGVGGAYGIVPMSAAVTYTGPQFYVPRFEYNTPNSAWNTNVVVLNASTTSKAHFAATFYDQNGNQVATASSDSVESGGVDPNRTWIIGTIPTLTNVTNPSSVSPPLSPGFVGSVVVTSSSGLPMDAMVIRAQFDTCTGCQFKLNVVGAYPVQAAAPAGHWAYLPAVRKGSSGVGTGAGTEATAFTLMNTQSTAQDFQVTYWDQNGNLVRRDGPFSLGPNQALYVDQTADGWLTAPFNGSVQVQNITNASPAQVPLVVADLYAQNFTPPSPSGSATPTPFPTYTPVPTPLGNVKVYLPDVSNGPNG